MNKPATYYGSIFRHGKSLYSQGNENQTLEGANDLTPESISFVRSNAEKMAAKISTVFKKIMIHSSPTGRTLHTSRIIKEVLEKRGFEVVVELDEEIGEVRSFSWSLFEPLMNGGTITYGQNTFVVNKKMTNPKGLGYPDYFMTDAIHRVSRRIKANWPKDFVQRLESFETFDSVTARVLRRTTDIMREHVNMRPTCNYYDVFVTHDAAVMFLLDLYTFGKKKSLEPGTCLTMGLFRGELDVLEIDGEEVVLPDI